MLDGIRVVQLCDPSGWLAGRMLADLGADVVTAAPAEAATLPYAWAAYGAGARIVEDPTALIGRADVVIETGVSDRYVSAPEHVIWCSITPFGRTGPKAAWRASDLAVQAQSGVMWMTGEPDRAPVACTYPTSWYHGCADAVAAIGIALLQRERTGRGQVIDVSLQEAHLLATMSRVGQARLGLGRGKRAGALMRVGRTVQREIWPCADGYVTFGLRGGPARIPGLKRLVAWIAEDEMATPALTERDWDSYNHNDLSHEDVEAISAPISAFFLTKSMTRLYQEALDRGLMLAPANTAREIQASRQSAARGLFVDGDDKALGRMPLPASYFLATGEPRVRPRVDAAWQPRSFHGVADEEPALAGVRVLEFGAGAAGPLATRYLADHGATVVRIESSARPDFLRLYAMSATQRSLDASPMFAAFNCNKLAITLNMKHPQARSIALRLVEWADVVAENFAPGAMARWGLSYDELRTFKPDLVMVSTCLHGQTGPERDYPGFGGQGAALSGFNHLTGYADAEPLGPYGTITDSLSPRFAASAVMAALVRRARTGDGAHIDLSQVECAVYCVADTVIEHAVTGVAPSRLGNRSPRAVPHGAFRCAGDDRWIAIACWSDAEWATLARLAGIDGYATLAERLAAVDAVEAALQAWTSTQERDVLAMRLRAEGLEGVEVLDLEDLNDDAQLAHRGHFHPMEHPVIDGQRYEALGFRLSASPPSFERAGPTLGRDNDYVYGEILGFTAEEIARLRADGALD